MEEKLFLSKVRKVLINKYSITIALFAVIMIFVGDSSLIQFGKRAKKINEVQEQIWETNEHVQQTQRVMNMLNDTDSLERFAREHYLMHADNEDIYIIEP